jgi:hypothetical protein
MRKGMLAMMFGGAITFAGVKSYYYVAPNKSLSGQSI